jgi:general secretion pathway protein G
VQHVIERPRRPARGFSLLELCAVIAVIVSLAALLLDRLLYYQELSEKTAVDLTLLNIRSGVRHQLADKMIRGRETELEQVLLANPVNWLERPPAGYTGEVAASRVRSLQPGSWFYDVERRELGYVPKLDSHLAFVESEAQGTLRWHIRGVRSKNGGVEDLSLVAVTRYSWF